MALTTQMKITEVANNNKRMALCWVPAHCGVAGDETTDKAAKEQTSNDQQINDKAIPHSDMGKAIRRSVQSKWQNQWNAIHPYRKHMKSLKPEIKRWKTSYNKDR